MDIKANLTFDPVPFVYQFSEIKAILWCIAEEIVDKKDWESFNQKFAKKRLRALIDYVTIFPDQFLNPEKEKSELQKMLDEMK